MVGQLVVCNLDRACKEYTSKAITLFLIYWYVTSCCKRIVLYMCSVCGIVWKVGLCLEYFCEGGGAGAEHEIQKVWRGG